VSWFQRLAKVLSDVRLELKRTTWPSRKEVRNTTIVVIVTVFVFAAFLGIVDFALGSMLERLLKYFSQ
jgi:preprotein translocase subunit SecE